MAKTRKRKPYHQPNGMPTSDEREKRAVICGMALALSEVQAKMDQPSIVGEVLRDAGLTTAKQLREAGVDPFDLRRLRTSLREAKR